VIVACGSATIDLLLRVTHLSRKHSYAASAAFFMRECQPVKFFEYAFVFRSQMAALNSGYLMKHLFGPE